MRTITKCLILRHYEISQWFEFIIQSFNYHFHEWTWRNWPVTYTLVALSRINSTTMPTFDIRTVPIAPLWAGRAWTLLIDKLLRFFEQFSLNNNNSRFKKLECCHEFHDWLVEQNASVSDVLTCEIIFPVLSEREILSLRCWICQLSAEIKKPERSILDLLTRFITTACLEPTFPYDRRAAAFLTQVIEFICGPSFYECSYEHSGSQRCRKIFRHCIRNMDRGASIYCFWLFTQTNIAVIMMRLLFEKILTRWVVNHVLSSLSLMHDVIVEFLLRI